MKIGLGFDKYPEKYDYIATFKDITGLEGEFIVEESVDNDDPTNICQLTLFECNIKKKEFLTKFNKESKLYNNSAYIYILSSKGEILTSNFISGIEIVKLFHNDLDDLNVIIDGWLHESSKGFYEIAKKRLLHGIEAKGTWKNLPTEKVQGWLDTAIRLSSKVNDISSKIVTIDSNGLDSKDKFYCALGEAVNGIGGYFGRDLQGLSDCLTGGFGIKGNFTLIWINHKVYKKQFPEYFKQIQQVFIDYKKELILK